MVSRQEEKKTEKLFYTMGEVAEMFDVNQSLIRFWEDKFDILRPHKNKKGNRLFTPQDIENLRIIYHVVKERGMTLAGAQKYLKANKEEARRDVAIMEKLLKMRALLQEAYNELADREKQEMETLGQHPETVFHAKGK